MSAGSVVGIYIASAARQPMQSLDAARAVPGFGLEGDRYFKRAGTFYKRLLPEYELTLVESEALEKLASEHGITLAPGASRRNLVTRGVALHELVGLEFSIGAVRVRGIKLCPPCSHLERLTIPGVKHGLAGRGGLRAQILTEGMIRVGDKIGAMQMELACAAE
jgi:MOSC domain-containing protein YiiM